MRHDALLMAISKLLIIVFEQVFSESLHEFCFVGVVPFE